MALGNNKPRNWGRDSQIAALNMLLLNRKVAFQIVHRKSGVLDLMVAPSDGKITLAFQTMATIEHVSNGLWKSMDVFSGEEITNAPTERDLVRKTIERRWM